MPKVLDRFPQPLKFQTLFPNGTDDLNNPVIFPLILPRAETKNQRIVTEVTKIVYDLGGATHLLNSEVAAAAGFRISVHYTGDFAAADNDHINPTSTIGDEKVLDAFSLLAQSEVASAVGVVQSILPQVYTHYLGDSSGYGLIFPGDRLFVSITNSVSTTQHTLGVAIYYRQHLVGLDEFLGILAARQQHT